MCGRFFQDLTAEELQAYFEADLSPAVVEAGARYNLGPGQNIGTLRWNPKTARRSIELLHWGLIPHFARDKKGAYRLINARAETLDRAAPFRAAFERRRALVVARGFFEWQKQDRRKQPFAVMRDDGGPLAFASVWENWRDPSTGEWLRSVAIVTRDASEDLRALHPRMPVVLPPASFSRWLGEAPATHAELLALLHDEPPRFRAYAVDPRMNRAEVDDASILTPVSAR